MTVLQYNDPRNIPKLKLDFQRSNKLRSMGTHEGRQGEAYAPLGF